MYKKPIWWTFDTNFEEKTLEIGMMSSSQAVKVETSDDKVKKWELV